MVHAVHDVSLPQSSYGFDDQRLVGVLDEPRELLGPQSPKCILQLAEGELDGVVLGSVRKIPDVPHAELLHLLRAPVAGVHGEVVGEQAELVLAVLLAELLQVLDEPVGVDRLGEDPEVLLALLLGDARQQRQRRLVQQLLRYGHVLSW